MTCGTCLKTLARGIHGVTKSVLRIDRATPDTIAARKQACQACPHSTKTLKGELVYDSHCTRCFCRISLKVTVIGEVCPDDPPKW